MKTNQDILEEQLSDFSTKQREEALHQLSSQHAENRSKSHTGMVNMHMHSFFSYNAYGWSPSRLAWEAYKADLYASAMVDFDVLEGLEEFLSACQHLGIRGAVGIETRAYLAEMADKEISSPGEPGVTYIMGMGFPRVPDTNSAEYQTLASFREQYDQRNEAMIDRINASLPEIAIAYSQEVKPLTPAGGVTERHIVRAYREKGDAVFANKLQAKISFWLKVLGKRDNELSALMQNIPAFDDAIRSKLTKKGGIGYEAPSDKTFPPVGEFIQWVIRSGGMPMVAWLDGTSSGEADPKLLLECQASKGAASLNIIPDRNWNIQDAAQQDIKVKNLEAVIQAAASMQMPINIGTEMNKDGLPYADDLRGPVLKRFAKEFIEGAEVMVGQTLLSRYTGISFLSEKAHGAFGNRDKQIKAFSRIGSANAISTVEAKALEDATPDKALAMLMDRSSH